ncbi:hypothetical protein [Variovorax paradoxus]|uniref:hypothetical protein n=1 Tax=Variovorax paradoxus TaxID=34073 RepID=UPI0019347358|nr:hypothetical protein INQ48_20580 [Variovorax paradoxus]
MNRLRAYFIEIVASACLVAALALGYWALCDTAGERMATVLAGLMVLCAILAAAIYHEFNTWHELEREER